MTSGNAIFFDLETSDSNPIGQILNYSFIAVDGNYKIIDELSGLIKISQLQLPSPGAILANRIDVQGHQEEAQDREAQALAKITRFLQSVLERTRAPVSFVGYNSSRFDLNFLRTSLIRNGFNPYYKGQLVSRDLLHLVRKAYTTHETFSTIMRESRKGEERLSLSLESVGRALEVLQGAQLHESRADVLLTIDVARWFSDNTGLHIGTFDAYEALRLHSTVRSGAVYVVAEPQYDLAAHDPIKHTPMSLLDADHRSALWIDLDAYAREPSPRAISWRSANRHDLFTSGQALRDDTYISLARRAIDQFKGITLKNFFEKSTCDIEQDIYRLDFDDMDALCTAISTGNRGAIAKCTNKDARVLWVRYCLANAPFLNGDEKQRSIFKQYAEHRYGGTLQISKNRSEESLKNHPTLDELLDEIDRVQDASMAESKRGDFALMESLRRFYVESAVYKSLRS